VTSYTASTDLGIMTRQENANMMSIST